MGGRVSKTKKCSNPKCGHVLPLGEFHKDPSRKDGLCFRCKECESQRNKKYRGGHQTEIVRRKREYYIENRDKVRRRNLKRWYDSSPEEYLEQFKTAAMV